MQLPSRNRGYTLIELLIVATVISILAIIAIPTYLNYVTRAKVSDVLNVTNTPKTGVVEYYSVNGALPDDNSQIGMGLPESYRTKYVAKIEILEGGVIQASLRGLLFNGHTLSLVPESESGNAVSWTCKSTLSQNLLPSSCRSTDGGGG